jgi:hypothetical protein
MIFSFGKLCCFKVQLQVGSFFSVCYLCLTFYLHAITIIFVCPLQDVEEKSWPVAILVGVGKFMYNIIMKDIKINVNVAKVNSVTE